jgi:hypothetical protein
MSQPGAPNTTAVVAVVESGLAEHLIDLLAAADVVAVDRQQSQGLTAVVVRAADLDRARDTLELVLPGVLPAQTELAPDRAPDPDRDGDEGEAGGRLSDRLIRRSDWPDPSSSPPQPPALVDGRTAFDALAGDDAGGYHDPAMEDDFIPPEPPPIPRGDVVSRFAWLGAIGGPILMVIALLVDLPSVVAATALAGFVLGFGVLVARMPDRARQDDGWDDGAVL